MCFCTIARLKGEKHGFSLRHFDFAMQRIAGLSAGFSLFRIFSLFASLQKEKIYNNKASIQKIKENPPSLRDTSFIKGGFVPYNINNVIIKTY